MGPCILWKQLQDSVSLWDMAVEDRFVALSNGWLYAYKLTMCIWYNMYNVYQDATTLTLCRSMCILEMHRLEFTSVALRRSLIIAAEHSKYHRPNMANGQIERSISGMKHDEAMKLCTSPLGKSPISCSARSPQNGDISGCGGATRRLQGADYVFVATQGHRKWSPFVDGEGGEDPHLPIVWPISPWVNPLFGGIYMEY